MTDTIPELDREPLVDGVLVRPQTNHAISFVDGGDELMIAPADSEPAGEYWFATTIHREQTKKGGAYAEGTERPIAFWALPSWIETHVPRRIVHAERQEYPFPPQKTNIWFPVPKGQK